MRQSYITKGGRIIYRKAKKALEIYSNELRSDQDEIMVNNLEDDDKKCHEIGKDSFGNDT